MSASNYRDRQVRGGRIQVQRERLVANADQFREKTLNRALAKLLKKAIQGEAVTNPVTNPATRKSPAPT